jgi:hypothetical protein
MAQGEPYVAMETTEADEAEQDHVEEQQRRDREPVAADADTEATGGASVCRGAGGDGRRLGGAARAGRRVPLGRGDAARRRHDARSL